MRRFRPVPGSTVEPGVEYDYARWMALRALSSDGRFRKAFRDSFTRPDGARPEDVGEWTLEADSDESVAWLQLFGAKKPARVTSAQLRRAVKAAARAAAPTRPVTAFRQTVGWLGGIIRLDAVDCALLELLLVMHHNDGLLRLVDQLVGKTLREDCELLADLLGVTVLDVNRALGRQGNLQKYGFLRYDHFYENFLARIEMPRELAAKLSHPFETEGELVSAFLNPVDEPALALDDVPHLATHVETLRQVLPNALKQGRRGINILFHGAPGTGKTQVAALLAQVAGLEGYRIIRPDESDPQSGQDRLGYYMIVQQMLANRRPALLVFDEFEDVVPDNDPFGALFGGHQRKSAPMKSWLTQVLEENPVPTVWICNAIHHIDRALLRRFTYAVEFRTPPASVRQRILSQALEGLPVSERWITRMAQVSNLSPAMVRNAATIASLSGLEDTGATEALLDRTIDGSMRAVGWRPERSGVVPVTRYDLSFVSANVAPEHLQVSLVRSGRGTLCFYGPPGTGKSALAAYLAAQLGRPLMIRRASDLLSKWVGGTEENIAQMFEGARDENAVLLIDEADSFLASRGNAERSWEVTQVNEMLSQIEHFEGVLICTTNRLEHMDPAVLRRFSHKVGFSYLSHAQRVAMFFSEFGARFAEDEHRPAVEAALAALPNLAPGDFATVRRQFDAGGGELALTELLDALAAECTLKPDRPRRSIGFAG